MKYLLILSILIIPALLPAQVRITAAAGLVATETGPKISGLLNAGYEYRNVSVMYDMRSALFQNAGYFGLHAGYSIEIEEDVYFKPYAGYWLRKTGKKAAQDRYVKDGQTTVLSTELPENLNGHNWGVGAQFVYHYFFTDFSYVSQWQLSVGVSFKF